MAIGKKWGFDLDGVLVDADAGFRQAMIGSSGRNLFEGRGFTPGPEGINARLRDFGYTQTEIDAMWAETNMPGFWMRLGKLHENTTAFDREVLAGTFDNAEIYFVTARKSGKAESERWLRRELMGSNPTVIRTAKKGQIAEAIGLDVFVEDRLDLALDVRIGSPGTRVYLLDRPYNAYDHEIEGITRVKTLADVFALEADYDTEADLLAASVAG